MRRLLALLSAAALVAACASHAPSETPILPWSPAEVTAAPTAAGGDASAAPSASSQWSWTCQPTLPTDDPASWVTIAPEGESFSVKLPGPALATTTPIATPIGDIPQRAWAYLDGCERTFGAARMSFPAGTLSKAGSPKDVLDAAVGIQMQSATGASLTAKSDVAVGGHEGRRFTLTGSDFVLEGLVVLAGDDLYIAGLWYTSAHALPAATVDAFFASFSFTA